MPYTLEQVIRAKLLEDAIVVQLVVDRIFVTNAPNAVKTPYVVLQLISAPEDTDIEGTASFATSRVQCAFLSEDSIAARDLLEACRSVLLDPAMRGAWFGVEIESIFVADKRDMGLDVDSTLYRQDLDLEVWQKI